MRARPPPDQKQAPWPPKNGPVVGWFLLTLRQIKAVSVGTAYLLLLDRVQVSQPGYAGLERHPPVASRSGPIQALERRWQQRRF
jgi:hypothetical protein